VKSWSAYHTYLDQHPDKDPIHAFEQDMLAALQAQVWWGDGPGCTTCLMLN